MHKQSLFYPDPSMNFTTLFLFCALIIISLACNASAGTTFRFYSDNSCQQLTNTIVLGANDCQTIPSADGNARVKGQCVNGQFTGAFYDDPTCSGTPSPFNAADEIPAEGECGPNNVFGGGEDQTNMIYTCSSSAMMLIPQLFALALLVLAMLALL